MSEGRNIGTHFAKGKIVAFLDDDAVVPDNYVESVLEAFKLPDVYAIRGKVLPKNTALKISEAYDLGDHPIPSCITAEGNSAYLKEVYLKLAGMNPLLFGHEGLDFSYRLFENDQKIHSFYWPQTKIYHNPADESKNKIKSQRYEIMNKFLVWLHPKIWQFHELLNRYAGNNNNLHVEKKDSEIPVVLITYNRPNHTKKVIESLRENRIKNLFIFSDAPKTEKDINEVKQTRELFNSIDWTTPTITIQNKNQGLAKSITAAIDTVFEKYDKVILLEDDCVPKDYFFRFMNECLTRYEHNEKVFGISGYTVPLPDDLLEDYKSDVYFFPRIGSWGWATWKSKWQKKENDLNNLLMKLKDKQIDITQGGNDVSLILEGMLNGSIKDVWTINWLLTVYLHKGYYVYPTKSHIANIGMDGTGVHCGKTDKYETKLADELPIEFPPEIIIDKRINQTFRKYYDVNISKDQASSINSKGLKVVHLCSQDFGGAGKAAYRLHKGLQSIGVNSIFITVNKQSGDPSVKVIPDKTSKEVKECINPATYQSALMNENYARWWGQLGVYSQRSKSIELFTDTVAPFKLNLVKEISEADVINLHWTSGMLDFENLVATFKGKNIVWTLHDMNSFTGGCHYNQGCQKFKTGCGNCPLLNSGIENDLSKRIFSIKEKSYKNLDIQIVTPSKWLGETAQESFLFSKFVVDVIPYGLPTDIFAAGSKDDIKKKIGIPPQYKVILFGADNVGNERKGFVYLLKALEKLKTKDDFILATFGNLPSEIKLNGKFKVITFGSISGENELAMIYNAADVFVLPSLEDNLPNTVLESLSCGTPVVAFNIGGIPDMIRHKKTGYLAEYKNPQSLAEGISWIINNKNLKNISHDCRKEALEKYPLELQAKNYLTIYQKLTRSNQAKPVKTLPANDHELQSNNGIKVSAIVSTYNSEKYIRGCLDDLLCQTLYQKGELEIVVVNSGSTQNEELIVNEYKDKYKNIKYLKTERETVYQAWNRGIKLASGKYLTNANTDDRHRKDALEILLRELDANVKVGLVYADQYVTKTENQTFDEHNVVGQFDWPEFDRTQLIHCACIGPQPMWKKSLHESFGYFSETLKVAGDYDWWLRISEKVKLKHIPEKLGLYLLSDNSIEHNLTDSMIKETVEIRKHYAIKAGLKNLDYNKYQSTFLVLTGKKHPLVSIIITTYNRPDDLKRAIQSVLNQTYKNFELIIVNDAGTDVEHLVKEFNDNKIKYIVHKKNKGLAAARNTGLKAAKGKYIAFLDDDDLFYKNHLEIAVQQLKQNEKVVYSDAVRATIKKENEKYIVVNKTVPYSIDYDRNKLLVGNIAPVNCFVFEKSLVDKAGLFDESLPVLEDWDFWLNLSFLTSFKHIKKETVQVNWYDDGSTMTSSKGEAFSKTRDKIYKKYESEIEKIPDVNKIVEEFNSIWRNDFNIEEKVSIITLTYNQLDYTKAFIDSVFQFTSIHFELIIVDNASNDDTIKFLKDLEKSDKRIKVIFNKENLGFPKGVNQALRIAEGNYYLIANNDIIVTDGWLERLIQVAENNKQIGLVGPISNNVSGVQIDKETKYNSIEEMHKYAASIKQKNKNQIFEFPRVAFLCTLIKKEVIERIGGLDERFSPGNFEDDDFCLRAQLAGYKTVVAKDVFIHHFGSKSFTADGMKAYEKRLETNKKIFIEKWGADPEEIWLHGKKIKERNIMYPLNNDEFSKSIERLQIFIEEKEYEAALRKINSLLENFDNQKAQQHSTSKASLLNLAGNLAMMIDDINSARTYFESALNEDKESSSACAGLAEIFFIEKNYEAAKTMYEFAYNNDPNNKSAQSGLEKVSALLKNTVEAEINIDGQSNLTIEPLLKNNADDSAGLVMKAYELFNENKYNESLDILLKAEKYFNGHLSNPTNVNSAAAFFNLKGFNYLGINETENARECFERALNLDPNSSEACAGLGEYFYMSGNNENAKIMFEYAVKNNPNNTFAAEELSKISSTFESTSEKKNKR